MNSIKKILKNSFVFIASYLAIVYVSLGIQWLGYFLELYKFFGDLFNPRYRLFVSNCDRTANYYEIVLFSITFLLLWKFVSKNLESTEKKLFIASYVLLVLTIVGRLLPNGWGIC